jgi:pentatricopeptide repeat protein
MEKANEYFQQVDFSKVKEPMILFASLIHGYAKHGQVNRSLALLKKMKEKGIRPNTGLFNGLIYGYCVNKDINGAFNLLNLIKMEGLEPDAQTFSGLIHAVYKNITNGGAKRAFQLWEIMKQHRDTIPWINYQPKVLTVLARTCYWAGPQRFVQARSGSDKNSIASPSGSGSNAGGGKSKEEIEEWQKRMWKLVDELQAEGLADVAGEAARWMREYEAGGKSNVVKERRTHRQKFRQHASIRQKMYE